MMDRTELELTLNKLAWIAFMIDELKDSYELPTDPEDRADLLLAAEDLFQTVVAFTKEVQDIVWNMPFEPDINQ